jgi:hypothetical protein
MQTQQGTSLERLRAARLFLDKYPERLGDVVKSGSRRQLDQAIADLESLALSQATGGTVVSGKQKTAELREELVVKHMLPISRIAAVDIPARPELADLKMPRGKPTPEKLVAAARAMAARAASFANIFMDAGLPSTFLEALVDAAAALAFLAAKRKYNGASGATATKGIRDAVSRGSRVMTALDGLMLKALDRRSNGDRLILSEWKSVKRVRKIATRSSALLEPVPIPPADAVPVAPAA